MKARTSDTLRCSPVRNVAIVVSALSVVFAPDALSASPPELAKVNSAFRVQIRPLSYQVPAGQPVRVAFWLENPSDETLTFTVPGTDPQIPPPEMGLPISHVFSSGSASGVMVTTESGRQWERPLGYRIAKEAPILLLAPRAVVGTVLDLREYYPALRSAGTYRITWKPYGGAIESPPVTIHIAARKAVEITLDEGKMTIELFYEDAPNHVANFLDLVKSNFYSGLTFHRLEPGFLIQGGCPKGDGTGLRADGKKIAAEPNSRTHHRGSVSMAIADGDADSASCQFFLCATEQREWDGKYTLFGQLIGDESFQTFDKLMSTPVDETGRPRKTLYMRSLRAIDMPANANPSATP